MKRQRFGFLDSLRGLVLISMICYHGTWDLVYLFGKNIAWYRDVIGYIWQQSICWTFILLSGFCWSLGKKHGKRGLLVFGAGAVVTLVTLLFMPENRVIFGVLTLLGSCMLLFILLDKVFRKIPAGIGLLGSGILFFLTRNINDGYLGFEGIRIGKELPEGLYQGMGMTFLGFPAPGFYSTDYFSLFPWLFLFCVGYFLFGLLQKESCAFLWEKVFTKELKPLAFLGRHSLLIYMLHQPVLYAVLMGLYRLGIL